MKQFLLAALLMASSFYSFSQSDWNWGLGTGTTLYFGDLGNEALVPVSGINQGATLTLYKKLHSGMSFLSGNAPFALQAQATWHRIGYDETKPLFNGTTGNDLRNFRRGLNFRNDLVGINAQFIYTFYPWPNTPLGDHKLALYLFVGSGVFYSNPRADLFRGSMDLSNKYNYWDDGTLRDAPQELGFGNAVERDGIYETSLRSWYTEGQSPEPMPGQKAIYGMFQIGFPHGGGIKYGLNRNITLLLEACFYDFPFTDYLDDASYRYATTEEIERAFPNDGDKQKLADYITDPSGWGTNGTDVITMSPRGNPDKFDWINYMNVQILFSINQHSHSYKAKSKSKKYCPTFRK